MKCQQSLWKLSLIKLILQLICIISSNLQPFLGTLFPQVSHLSPIPSVRTISKTLLLQTHQKHLFLNFEPQLRKSKEFNNQGLKINRNFKYYILFLPSNNNKKQTSSASNYQGFISLPAYLHTRYCCENFQIYGKLKFLEDALASQNIDLDIFTHMLPLLPPILPIAPAVRTLLQVPSSPLR